MDIKPVKPGANNAQKYAAPNPQVISPAPQAPNAPVGQSPEVSPSPTTLPSKGSKKLKIVLIVLFAVSLLIIVGLVIFSLVIGNNEQPEVQESAETQQEIVVDLEDGSVSADDVQGISEQINRDVNNLDDSSDFSDSDLSDSTLGL